MPATSSPRGKVLVPSAVSVWYDTSRHVPSGDSRCADTGDMAATNISRPTMAVFVMTANSVLQRRAYGEEIKVHEEGEEHEENKRRETEGLAEGPKGREKVDE